MVTTATRTGPLPRCPVCGTLLDGGPVAYRCPVCRHGVMAADIRVDYRPEVA